MKRLLVLNLLVLILAACGGSPTSPAIDTSGTPGGSSSGSSGGSGSGSGGGSGSPAPVTVLSFIYFNSRGICDAMDAWDPTTQTLFFPVTSLNAVYYSFEESGVYFANPDGSHLPGWVGFGGNTQAITKDDIHGTICTITVTDGQFVGVN